MSKCPVLISPVDKEGKEGENKTELNISLYKVLKVSEWNVLYLNATRGTLLQYLGPTCTNFVDISTNSF